MFGESLNGISTIRAFKVQKRFITQMKSNIDENIKIYYNEMWANRWLGIRLEITGSFIILFATLFSVIQRQNISPGIAGLTISYALTVI